MNPPYWDSLPRARHDYDRPQCVGTEQDMGKYTLNYNDQHYHQDHYRYHQREPQRPTMRMEYGQHSITSPSPSPGLISCREPSVDLGSDRTIIPDDPSVELAEIDNELERKKKKLEEIENRIIRAKAAIALKKILPYLKKNDELSDNPLDDQKDLVESCLTTTNESSLKERVNCILQQRKSLGMPKMHGRDPKSSTTYGVGRQENHPLKLRVKALMDNRSRTLRENPSFLPPTATLDSRRRHAVDGPKMQLNPYPPMSRSPPESSPVHEPWPTDGGEKMQVDPYPTMSPKERAKESPSQDPGPKPRSGLSAGFQHVQPHGRSQTPRPASPSPAPSQRPAIARGMQRFLNVLNKGVDMDLFTSIVNDDSKSVTSDEVLPPYKPSRKEPSRSENDRAEPHLKDSHPSESEHRGRSRSSTELPATEGSPKERGNPSNDGGTDISATISSSRHCPLSSESGSPRVEEENPMQLQLQNILKTLGLSLDKEEMSGLTSRTEERLNGKSKDKGQGCHNPPGGEMPFEPAPEPCEGTSTSVPPRSRPAGRPPLQRTQGEDSMEGRKKRRLSPCSQSVDRSPGDSGQRGRRTDDHKRRETDGCGDAGTDATRDREPSGASRAEKRQQRGRHRDPETYRRQEGNHHGNPETYRRQDGDRHGDPETYSRQDGDRHGDPETYRRQDGDRHGDPETYRRQDGDRHGDPETYSRQDGDRHGDPETYRRQDGDRHGNSETCNRQDGDRHGDPETYSRQDGDRHGNPETYRRQDGDRHGDPETYRRQDGDRHGDTETYRRQDGDRHGDTKTYRRQDGDRHGNPETYRRQDGDRHGDPETYRRQDGDRHGNPETYRRQDGDRHGDTETYRRKDGDRHGDPETYRRKDEDHHGNPETYRRKDGDRHGDPEIYRRKDGDRHGDTETYRRQDGDRHGDSVIYKRQDGDRHGNPATYRRQDGDRHGDPETYRRPDGDRHGDSGACRRQDGDHHGDPKTYEKRDHRGDRVKISSRSPQARRANPDSSSAIMLPGNTSTEYYQNTNYHGSAINGSSHVNTLGDATPYPHLSASTGAHNPSYPPPGSASSYPLSGSASSSYPLSGSASSSYPLSGSASSAATSTPRSKPADGVQWEYILNPDLSKSEGQHWSAQRCLQVVNIRPAGKTRCLTVLNTSAPTSHETMMDGIQGEIHSRTWTEMKPALPKPAAQLATKPPQRPERVTVQMQEVLGVQKQEVLGVQKQEVVVVQRRIKIKKPTEEERKTALKEKLLAFNQKMKQSPFMPAPVSSCTYSDLT